MKANAEKRAKEEAERLEREAALAEKVRAFLHLVFLHSCLTSHAYSMSAIHSLDRW